MPQRLESFHNKLNKENMRCRLFYIYKWMVGRREASRDGYIAWLKELADWFKVYVKSDKGKEAARPRITADTEGAITKDEKTKKNGSKSDTKK